MIMPVDNVADLTHGGTARCPNAALSAICCRYARVSPILSAAGRAARKRIAGLWEATASPGHPVLAIDRPACRRGDRIALAGDCFWHDPEEHVGKRQVRLVALGGNC